MFKKYFKKKHQFSQRMLLNVFIGYKKNKQIVKIIFVCDCVSYFD